MDKLQAIYRYARDFTEKNHQDDIRQLKKMSYVVASFEEFFPEYCYCVVASGFKGQIAARIAGDLADCGGDYEKCLKIFKNKQKITAICRCHAELSSSFAEVSRTWQTPEDLMALPYIGPVTCYHLARNIGLYSCVKPDLHMMRLVNETFGGERTEAFVQKTISELARRVDETAGVTDFCLWVWMSHQRGCVSSCCGGLLRLR